MSHLLLVDAAGDSGGPLSIEGARWPTAGITENIQVGITRYDCFFRNKGMEAIQIVISTVVSFCKQING